MVIKRFFKSPKKLFFSIVNRLISKFGIQLRKIVKGSPSTFQEELERFEHFGSEREWRQVMLYSEIMPKIFDINGDIAEFGVASGTSLKAFTRIINILNTGYQHEIAKKKIYGFDSFQGLPKLSKIDNAAKGGKVIEGLFSSSGTLDVLNKFVSQFECVEIINGLFEETLEKFLQNNPHMTFSLIHIDCDIYEPTKFVLENIIDKLSIGGIILFDEIFHPVFPGETAAFLEVYNKNLIEKKGIELKFYRCKSMPWKWYCIRIK